ncbi:MAG: Asp-tRNA(Asn)/Glu-tRNA(Gln) amidotransferase GatCAB subunit B, partial [Planctomycetota bacterium]|nr:Asp-tRNA(Asn)/Glu-tRNA(Gln) amidotransferase GatCAB subunit B [Planctomycetota bacterium]
RAYGESLRQLAIYLGVGHCNMQLGQMRFEPNISLKIGEAADGTPRYTPITEIKNLNSFRSVERACDFEIRRHRDELAADPEGYTLENQGKSTRGWNDDRGASFLQRSKEEAHDYRYFPEPDLVPVRAHESYANRPSVFEMASHDMPELPADRRRRFIDQYGLPASDAGVLTADRDRADFFEQVAKAVGDAKTAANWMMQDVMRALNERNIPIGELDVTPQAVVEVIGLVEKGTISRSAGTEVFARMVETGKSAAEIVEEENLAQTSDAGELERIVDEVIAENPGPAQEFADGVDKAVGRLIGMAKKKTGGKANPKVVREILVRKLRG